MACLLESVVSKVTEMVFNYTVVPVGRQFMYLFLYKTCIAEMNDVIHKLKNEKEIVDVEKVQADNNGQLIHKKVDDWLEAVAKAQEEVSSLMNTFNGQILNPIARHKLGKKATKKIPIINQLLRERPQHDDISYAPPPPGIVSEATSAAAAQHANVFRSSRWEETLKKIMTALVDDHVNVIGLHGMGGVGKTTMIDEVRHQVLKEGLFNEVAKAVVTKDEDILRIQEEIAHELGLKLENRSQNIRAYLLSERLLKMDEKNDMEKKKKKTVLIILDDLWEQLELPRVGIPSSNDQVQIKLLLTSRDEILLSLKMGAQPIHLDILSEEEAWKMFSSAVGNRVESAKKDTATEIAKRCSGLPIVIMAIAKALKNKDLDEWEKTLKLLDNDDVLKKLKVSYDYLPRKASKDLFLLCGIIRGPLIQVKDLLKYTFGLGLYQGKRIHTLTDAATELEKLLIGLEAASMLLKCDYNRYVKIHDRMRDLAVEIVDEDRLEWAYDLNLNDDRATEKFEVSKLELLSSYCELEGNSQLQVPDSFFKDMKKLSVLEFTNLRGSLSPTRQFGLEKLRTLCLHKCSLSDISIIGELKGLQILSFRGSDIRKLPIQLRDLTALRMLDLSDCEELEQIEPTVLGSLIMLEELNMENSFSNWEIDQEGDAPPSNNARLIELNSMSRLSNVTIQIPSTSMLPKECRLFSSKLTMYQIMLGCSRYFWYHYNDAVDYNKFSRVLMLKFDSPDILQQDWVQATLESTEVLYLGGCLDGKCESIGELCVKGFECLKHLQVINCPSIRYIVSSNYGSFRTLESLFLGYLEKLEKLCDGLPGHEEVFSKLKFTDIRSCDKLTHLFDFSLLKGGLSSQLEEIIVWGCNEMQCIVIDEDDKKEDVVTLLKLRKLHLGSLHKFSSFCKQPRTPSKALFTGEKVAFPHLESLAIWHLNELEDIWHPNDSPAELGKLRFLCVRWCEKLVRVINSNVLTRLQHNLESLIIEECELMEQVFDVEEEEDRIISGICSSTDQALFPRLKNLSLENLKRFKNNNLMMVGRSDDRVLTIFPNIESLKVKGCDGLRYVLSCSLPAAGMASFQLLKEIWISDCVGMEAIVVVGMSRMVNQETQQAAATRDQNCDGVVLYSYPSLKKLEIRTCIKLKRFCWYNYCSEQQVSDDALPFFSQREQEIFPYLETLKLIDLNECGQIWPHEVVAAQRSFYMLKRVKIVGCPKLSAVFPSTMIEHLQKLEYIQVWNCESMRTIVGGKNSKPTQLKEAIKMKNTEEAVMMEMLTFFPCLRGLFLENLRNLDRFYSSSATSFGFNFPSLETLLINNCPGVTMLFTQRPNGLVEAGDHDSDGIGVAFFGYCHKLDKSIPNITCLVIERCYNLKQVVAEEADNEKGVGDDLREITFNHLKTLSLYSLDSLESFSSVNNNDLVLNFPSLEELTISKCPKMRIFSNGILRTPKLQQLNWDKFTIQLCGGDVNTTIQKIYTEQQVSTSSVVSDSPAQLS